MKFSILICAICACVCACAISLSAAHAAPQKSPTKIRRTIIVNKWDNTLRFYQTGQPTRRFPVATGLYRCTPEGSFRVIQKSFISRGGKGQFGTRWIGLNTLGKRGLYRIGIHGTNQPETIGKYASKACVRMNNRDVNWLYERVPQGTTVRIVNVAEAPPPPKIMAQNTGYLPMGYTKMSRFGWMRTARIAR